MTTYYRPVPRSDAPRPENALPLAGGPLWFSEVVALARNGNAEHISPSDVPPETLDRLTAPRAPIAGLDMTRPTLMGILNVTPDSFSDGGRYTDVANAEAQARAMVEAGAGLIDIGGESTRPGAETVDVAEEIRRVSAPIAAVSKLGMPVSIDTRKAPVAKAAVAAGAVIVNDVAGFTYDADLAPLCASHQTPVCVMHAQGDPQTMQDAPQYEDVRFDVYDFLEERVSYLESLGLSRSQIMIDPGIGFGKTVDHNLALLRDLSLYHGIGCPILLGASRKKFIGVLSGADIADTRMPGSVAVALHAARQGVQVIRVHDVLETRQALALWRAIDLGDT